MFSHVLRTAASHTSKALTKASSVTQHLAESLHQEALGPSMQDQCEVGRKNRKEVLLAGEKESGREALKRKRSESTVAEDAQIVLEGQRAKLQKRFKDAHVYRHAEYLKQKARQPAFKYRKPRLTVVPLPSSAIKLTPTSPLPSATDTKSAPSPPSVPNTIITTSPSLSAQEGHISATDRMTHDTLLCNSLQQSQALFPNEDPLKEENTRRAGGASVNKAAERYASRVARLRQHRRTLKKIAKDYHKAIQDQGKKVDKFWIICLRKRRLRQQCATFRKKQLESWQAEQGKRRKGLELKKGGTRNTTPKCSKRLYDLRKRYKNVQAQIKHADGMTEKCRQDDEAALKRAKSLRKKLKWSYDERGRLRCKVSAFLSTSKPGNGV